MQLFAKISVFKRHITKVEYYQKTINVNQPAIIVVEDSR
jgi:hypothetical protein